MNTYSNFVLLRIILAAELAVLRSTSVVCEEWAKARKIRRRTRSMGEDMDDKNTGGTIIVFWISIISSFLS